MNKEEMALGRVSGNMIPLMFAKTKINKKITYIMEKLDGDEILYYYMNH